MPTNLSRLKVSLTKHGAHKIAFLLAKFDKDDILNHLKGDYKNINIDEAQTRRILSINSEEKAPELWNEIKKYGEEDIFDLVFFAIVLSHYQLIETITSAYKDNSKVIRGEVIDGKAFTNFARIIEDLKFSIKHTTEYISFDISRIFHKFYLSKFIYELLRIKLHDAGWEAKNDLIDEALKLGLNRVFGLGKSDFESWLEGNSSQQELYEKVPKARRKFKKGIKFTEGHNTKFTGHIDYEVKGKKKRQLLHNRIQNEIYEILCIQYPEDKIGSEIKTNVGSVDIVRKKKESYIFYEIKTAKTIKTSIRQALSQLLEYAYWNDIAGVERLIIVAPNKITQKAKRYLNFLRSKFNISIYYQEYDIHSKQLSELY